MKTLVPPVIAVWWAARCRRWPRAPAARWSSSAAPAPPAGNFFQHRRGHRFFQTGHQSFLWAARLAKEVNARLHIFHAVDINASEPGKVKGQAEIENALKRPAKKSIANTLEAQGFDNYEIGIREGTPYVEILKFAREKQADLIVMAHHTREIDPELALLGSTVEQVVLRSSCPVASVNHPDKT
jgi:nucleotide-binding universal stress UspA family protein